MIRQAFRGFFKISSRVRGPLAAGNESLERTTRITGKIGNVFAGQESGRN